MCNVEFRNKKKDLINIYYFIDFHPFIAVIFKNLKIFSLEYSIDFFDFSTEHVKVDEKSKIRLSRLF